MRQRLRQDGKKCLLSLDGGGVRGIFSLQILKKIEEIAEQYSGNPDIRLADCFDYIAGTSTGGILAAGLAMGMRVDELQAFYKEQAANMFSPNSSWFKRLTSARYETSVLQDKLQEVFGLQTTLGSPALKTLLMLVMLNASTCSPWPISSNPRAVFNDPNSCETASNLNLPLWQLVRASAAAPFFFEPEGLDIGGREHLFFDGALTSYNNPAFKLFQMATLPAYRLGWETGADKMLMVSVGTGLLSRPLALKSAKDINFLDSLPAAIQSLMFTATTEQDLLCRSLSRVIAGEAIDSEVGDMKASLPMGGNGLFSYARYNVNLAPDCIASMGLSHLKECSFALDSLPALEPCIEIGKFVAEQQVHITHFSEFWGTSAVC